MSELACAYVLCAYAGRSICDARFSCAQCRRTTPAGILVLICFFPRLWCRRGGGVKVMAAFVNVFVALMPKSPTRMVLKRHYSVHSLAFIFGYPLLATRSADVAVKCESGVVCVLGMCWYAQTLIFYRAWSQNAFMLPFSFLFPDIHF